MKTKSMIVLVALFFSAACAPPQQAPTSVPAPTGAETGAATAPGPTEAAPTQTAAVLIATAPVYVPFTIRNTVENTVLRAGPSSLFTAKTALAQNTDLVVIGIAPGGEWVFVITPLDSTGWIFAGLLETSPQLKTAPVIQPADLQVVRGRVLDAEGAPVDGIQFAVIEGAGETGSPPRVDATTDAEGIFYAFLPLTATGAWTVGLTAVACTSSQMGPNCECPSGGCGTSEPASKTVTLPTEEIIQFTWK
ncbi:MAG TPA: hypothetical protein VI524_08535 [Anaerolineales bacterium]|nr:hypothetical protein [Anaerolineales bacterium]